MTQKKRDQWVQISALWKRLTIQKFHELAKDAEKMIPPAISSIINRFFKEKILLKS